MQPHIQFVYMPDVDSAISTLAKALGVVPKGGDLQRMTEDWPFVD